MNRITEFKDEFSFLSNFYPSVVEDEGITYPSVEHAFQAAKSLNNLERLNIKNANSPGKAKRMGRKVTLREDWNELKIPKMAILVLQKFSKHNSLKNKLIATGNTSLIEGNTWHDNFWGDCICYQCRDIVGLNALGLILEDVRLILTGNLNILSE